MAKGDMKKNEGKSEFELYMEAVVPYMTTFMNELEDGNRHIVERTVAQMKPKFALDDAQEAALTIVLFNLEMMHYACHEDFPFEGYMGVAINTVVDIVLKDWRTVCDKRLAEPPAELMDYDDDDDEDDVPEGVADAVNAYRDLLIKLYGTVSGRLPKDEHGMVKSGESVTYADVMRAFFIDGENIKAAQKVLAGYTSKMEKLSKGTTQQAVARLLDQTIEKLMKLSSKWEK